MGIRNSAKAILLDGNRILLNQVQEAGGGVYYTLPGGGQNPFETMEQAVMRECMEETGYSVTPVAFAALYEEIHRSERFRSEHPDYAHRILHVFRCALADANRNEPTEQDSGQTGCRWINLEDLPSITLHPDCIAKNIDRILKSSSPLYLGTQFVELRQAGGI